MPQFVGLSNVRSITKQSVLFNAFRFDCMKARTVSRTTEAHVALVFISYIAAFAIVCANARASFTRNRHTRRYSD